MNMGERGERALWGARGEIRGMGEGREGAMGGEGKRVFAGEREGKRERGVRSRVGREEEGRTVWKGRWRMRKFGRGGEEQGSIERDVKMGGKMKEKRERKN